MRLCGFRHNFVHVRSLSLRFAGVTAGHTRLRASCRARARGPGRGAGRARPSRVAPRAARTHTGTLSTSGATATPYAAQSRTLERGHCISHHSRGKAIARDERRACAGTYLIRSHDATFREIGAFCESHLRAGGGGSAGRRPHHAFTPAPHVAHNAPRAPPSRDGMARRSGPPLQGQPPAPHTTAGATSPGDVCASCLPYPTRT